MLRQSDAGQRRNAWVALLAMSLLGLGLGALLTGCGGKAGSTGPTGTGGTGASGDAGKVGGGSSASAAATSTASAAPAASAADPTAGWTRYSDATDQFSFRYPPSWVKRTCLADTHASVYLAPIDAALGICNSGFGGQLVISPSTGDQRANYQLSGASYTDLVTTTVTVAGVSGQRQSATVVASGPVGPEGGTKIVQYLFFVHGRTYLCYYSQAPAGPTHTNVLPDFERLVTLTLAFTA